MARSCAKCSPPRDKNARNGMVEVTAAGQRLIGAWSPSSRGGILFLALEAPGALVALIQPSELLNLIYIYIYNNTPYGDKSEVFLMFF